MKPLGDENLEERLIGHVELVGEGFEGFDHGDRQKKGNCAEGRLEFGQTSPFVQLPVDVLRGVVGGPELPLLFFGLKLRCLLLGGSHTNGRPYLLERET